jgi:hypothetical protein
MTDKCQVPVCANHLGLLYAAIRDGNLPLISKVEHELTIEEKCVACSYVFKTHGTVKQALVSYLNDSGFEVASAGARSLLGESMFWLLRGGILFVTVISTGFLLWLVKYYVLGMRSIGIFSFSLLELTVVILSSLVIFLVMDDLFLD